MHSTMMRGHGLLLASIVVVVLASLLAITVNASTPSSASTAPHKQYRQQHHVNHKRFHQGISHKKPSQFSDGVFESRMSAMVDSQLKTRKSAGEPGTFLVGSGIWDVTGQVAEIGFMGYAVIGQKGGGLLFRSRSRAFIFVDNSTVTAGQQANRVVYVSIDLCMGFQMVKDGVIDLLTAKYGDLYTHNNVMISGTHTHSTPGGIGGTVLVDITTLGFIKENYAAAVNGIFNSIVQAHERIAPARIKMNIGQCDECNINRSPSAYPLNVDASQYANNTDHEMTVLRIENLSGEEVGMINWFAVHGTSLNNTNLLVAGDNKGLAAMMFEEMKNPGAMPGMGSFVAAFGQSNLGDVSPNTRGPRCPDGSLCDFNTSTCGGKTEGCIASGPGVDMYDSMDIIAQKQFDAALELYNTASEYLTAAPAGTPTVDSRYAYFDMQQVKVDAKFTSTGKNETTCLAAMGYSFAAGTTDGPGDFDFTQGTKSPNAFWAFVSAFLAKPTPEQIACQAPKPILLDVAGTKPMEWVPFILPEQLYRIGNLWIVGIPGELTTMSGRRIRATIKNVLQARGEWYDDSHVVIAGLSNSYSHYIATYEEYQQQRYEGASTLYGPHTLAAHMQNLAGLADAIATQQPVPLGPLPADMRGHTFSLMPGVIYDGAPLFKHFGDVLTQPASHYAPGSLVSVSFIGASPRNDLKTQSSYLFVDQQQADGSWVTVFNDGHRQTQFQWKRVGLDQSHCTVLWQTNANTVGTYRIRHQGVWRLLGGHLTPYEGTSNTFTVSA